MGKPIKKVLKTIGMIDPEHLSISHKIIAPPHNNLTYLFNYIKGLIFSFYPKAFSFIQKCFNIRYFVIISYTQNMFTVKADVWHQIVDRA